ncbi:hypothetical protein QMK19_27065 [Streptomyces sp. H10-C2]|uniref:hypothetical protein n=1 Tax=unclassified Streptomyces TaxID=2593676 RepID=UPI0024B8F5AC|nr:MULTISPECIES: hypothetical protein [unclassified Streptomyces]MDJ0344624.1 hypothetical protein [Streptomyces sp. PH10-H1]MDJ0373216.1 hypothetical protein [Streptomyces sp. H10-C2]
MGLRDVSAAASGGQQHDPGEPLPPPAALAVRGQDRAWYGDLRAAFLSSASASGLD